MFSLAGAQKEQQFNKVQFTLIFLQCVCVQFRSTRLFFNLQCDEYLLPIEYFTARQLQKERQEKTARQNVIEQKRKTEFEKIFNHKEDDIFKLRGLTILKFTYLKVKFMFLPSQIVQHVCTKVAFFCSLKYLDKYGYWSVKRDSFPVSYKWRIYPLFYENGYHKIDDISLPIVIERIYKRLEHWANKEELFRLEKFMVSICTSCLPRLLFIIFLLNKYINSVMVIASFPLQIPEITPS